jgi:hypothetical protein
MNTGRPCYCVDKSECEHGKIAAVIATFPETFGLRAFPGDTFRVSASASYFSGNGGTGTLNLYTQRRNPDGVWCDFAKGTESELRAQITEAP